MPHKTRQQKNRAAQFALRPVVKTVEKLRNKRFIRRKAWPDYIGVEENPDFDPEDWDFWEDEANVRFRPYDSRIDYDAFNVLKGIAAGKYNTEIAAELRLPEQYVELLQSILCSADWCQYGVSPRGCWIHHELDKDKIIEIFARYVYKTWLDDKSVAELNPASL